MGRKFKGKNIICSDEKLVMRFNLFSSQVHVHKLVVRSAGKPNRNLYENKGAELDGFQKGGATVEAYRNPNGLI